MTLPVFAVDGEWSISSDVDWTRVYPANNQHDALHDQQTGSGSVSQDIVGDSTYPSTYMHFSDTEVAFRIRVNNINGGIDSNSYQYKNFAFVGIDADVDGSVDFFLGAYNPTGNNGRLGIYGASSGYTNTGPSTTGISGKPLMAFKPERNVNYAITKTADGSNFDGNADYFIAYKFSVAEIERAVAGLGYSFSKSTPFRFMVGTASQDNSFNQDISGMGKAGWKSKGTWNSLDVFSDIVSADGSVTYYTVTFDKNTGDTEASPTIKKIQAGSSLGSLPEEEPTKRGMFFQEWNTSQDGSGETVTASTVINASTTVYAIWSDKQVYTVTFNPNNGNWNGSTTSLTVSTIQGVVGDNMPPFPKNGTQVFEGWNTAKNGSGTWLNSTTVVDNDMTVYAIWTSGGVKSAVFYNNFTSDGGSIVATIFSNNGGNFPNRSMPNISRTGYTFEGWYNNKECIGSKVTALNKGSEGNYYAKWTQATYTITFNGNGGSVTENSRQVTDGLFGTMPLEPTRADYTFIEWNRDQNGTGEAMYPTSVISGNTTVYAIWKPFKTVTFNANGGLFDDDSGTHSITAVEGKLEYLPQPPFRDDFTFLGWGTSSNASTVVDLRDVSAYTHLYAVWSPVYKVTFDTNGGSWGGEPEIISTNVLTAYGSVLYIPITPSRANYSFVEWNTEADGTGTAFTLSTPVTQDIAVYAKWESNAEVFTVQFDTNGGSAVNDRLTNYIATAPDSIKPGYTLDGWYSDSEMYEESKVHFPFNVTVDTTLYAKWTANTYSVELNDNGGSGGSINVKATYDQPMPTATAPTRDGYTFIGYYDQPSSGTQYYNADMTSVRSWDQAVTNPVLYAQWQANQYSVNFDANGGQYSGGGTTEAIDQTFNSKYVLPSESPTRSGYTFSSWNTKADGNGTTISANTDVTISEVHNVYAIWIEASNVTIQYEANNTNYGTVSRAIESLNPENGIANGSEATANLGYHFVEWRDERGHQVSTNAIFIPPQTDGVYVNATYTAIFAPNTNTNYKVEHYVMDTDGNYPTIATKMDNKTGTTDSTLTLVNFMDNSLVLQNGIMYDKGSVDNEDAFITTIKSDGSLVIKLYYIRSQYGLTLHAGTGTSNAIGGGTFYYGQTVMIDVAVDSGYTWDKWESSNSSLLADQADNNASITMPVGNITLTAKAYIPSTTYQIKYNLGGGTVNPPNPETYTDVDDAFTLNNPTKAGYTFAGWIGTGLMAPTINVKIDKGSTGDRSYTASWTANTYSVTLNDNGGSGGSGDVTAMYDQPMPAASQPTREGYTFAGYYDALTDGIKYYNADMSSAKNWDKPAIGNTLYARWTAHDVIGIIVDEAPVHNKIKGAIVKIVKGNTLYGETTTDADGNFIIYNVPAGTYNLIMIVDGKTEIIAIRVNGDTPVTNLGVIIFPLGNASSALKLKGSNTPWVVVGNLHPEAEDYFKAERDPSLFVKVEMTVERTDEESAKGDPSILTAINSIKTKAKATNTIIGLYLDMVINKYKRVDEKVDWNHAGNITQTGELIEIIIPIPIELRGKSSYVVYRDHENQVNTISTTPNVDGEYLAIDTSDWTLTLHVKKFSIYALGYYANGSGGSGGNSGTPFYEITFEGNGGTLVTAKQSVALGNLLAKPADPIRDGYHFAGWYKADGSVWNFDTDRVFNNITLTAKWTAIPALDKVNHFAYMQGYPDNTFGPDKNMTRSEATVMFARLLVEKMDVDKKYSTRFKDVDGSKWYANAIGYMEQYGIIKGYSDGTFRPNAAITRAEFAAIASRFDNLITGEPIMFSDVKATHWAKDYISSAAAKGWIKGYTNGTFRPDNYITRAEVVTLVNRMLERYSDRSYVDSNSQLLKQYIDLQNTYWAYYEIMEASTWHDYEKSSISETWLRMTK